MLGFGEGGEEVGFGFGGAVGPGFVAFEVGVEAAFCLGGGRLISCERIGDFLQSCNGLWMRGLQWEGKFADPAWANEIVRGTVFEGP